MSLRIAHSNIQPTVEDKPVVKQAGPAASEFAVRMAKKGFIRSMKKPENIARLKEIQKYFPGWEPQFRYPF